MPTNPKKGSKSPFDIRKLSHVNFYYSDFNSAIHFFVTGLGFKASDIIDSSSPHPLSTVLGTHPLCFLRLNSDHHSSALFPELLRVRDKNKEMAIQQFSWEVSSYEQVKKGLEFLNQNDVELDFVGRRMPGSNYNLYFWDPEGFRIEITWGIEQVGWPGSTKPLKYWDALRQYDSLPEGPVLPGEEESKKLESSIHEQKWSHSLDNYEVAKWEHTGKSYNVGGVALQRPFLLRKPSYLGLVVQNLAREVAFYTRVLGFKLLGYMDAKGRVSPKAAKHKVALLSSTADYALCLYPREAENELGFESTGQLVHAAFEVDTLKELEDAPAYFKEVGIPVVAQGSAGSRDYVVDTRDPEGRVVRLVCRNQDLGKRKVTPLWKPSEAR